MAYDEALEEQWIRADNGLRMTGHSLSQDLLYTSSELKLNNKISDRISVVFNLEHEVFYYDQSLQDPKIEVAYRPLQSDMSLSFISTTDYIKSEVDMGGAVTWGRSTGNFLRLEQITVDPLFNEKNSEPSINDAEYKDFQDQVRLKAAYQWGLFELYIDYVNMSNMSFVFDDKITNYTHSGYTYNSYLKYAISSENTIKLTGHGFKSDVTLSDAVSDQHERLDYGSINIKWITRSFTKERLVFGMRFDEFRNKIVDPLNSSNNLDYSFSATQLYTSYKYSYGMHKAWDFGVYMAEVREPYDETKSPVDINRQSYQSQFRASWIQTSPNNKSSLQFHVSVNLDDLVNDIGDGVGMTYHSIF
ncbi:MAG: hypothetical protein OEX03_05485 [Gammaproteobacteria bacterium]|nr:hypothetical protein [Gammaproteobacteria bacterium]